ncbi:D-TA family PLP-dependent enzyme [Flavobacterium sp. LS1R49]|uniref:D-TA family PLP-dependent enzyme n=1 Tax=Flavobacterium shii TaxID=2987687 RepID=A0A9X3C5F1_9FLAO|nr:D-TA family PLP-dependent enzyme [Flavobacterium shii]MCV9930224.1 D-TA family PLP-dependent enzyme [Flavobacterium shii]
MENNWWKINPKTLTDTPFLALYVDRIRYNIEHLIESVNGNTQRLRPHIKTHKLGEILDLYKTYKINKVKCATIAEVELCAIHNVSDILLAYQPTGLKQKRWITLLHKYSSPNFSTIVDNIDTANELSELGKNYNLTLNIYLDINAGMDRTGVDFKSNWEDLVISITQLPNINFLGLHIYDGHLKGTIEQRTQEASDTFNHITNKLSTLKQKLGHELKIIAGGSNTFPFYATQENVESSPGTFVFWDINYQTNLPEQNFKPAAVLVGTIISKPTENTLCIDIGYKSVASENPLDKRLTILNDDKLIPISHSEEHLVLENKGNRKYKLGETIYAIPYHICPTCALYETVQIVNSQRDIYDEWTVLARNKKISI